MLGKNFFVTPFLGDLNLWRDFYIREKYIGDKTDDLLFPKRVIGCFYPECMIYLISENNIMAYIRK